MTRTEYEAISLCLRTKHKEWLESQGRGFNFSKWVREKIEEEILKDKSEK